MSFRQQAKAHDGGIQLRDYINRTLSTLKKLFFVCAVFVGVSSISFANKTDQLLDNAVNLHGYVNADSATTRNGEIIFTDKKADQPPTNTYADEKSNKSISNKKNAIVENNEIIPAEISAKKTSFNSTYKNRIANERIQPFANKNKLPATDVTNNPDDGKNYYWPSKRDYFYGNMKLKPHNENKSRFNDTTYIKI